MTLHKGELQYKERLEDIRLLKLEIRHQRCRNNVLEKSNEVIDDLRLIGMVLHLTLACCILQSTYTCRHSAVTSLNFRIHGHQVDAANPPCLLFEAK